MFKSLSRGMDIAMASWTVLKRHPKLTVFPALSALAIIALLALFAGVGAMPSRQEPPDGGAAFYVAFFAIYFVSFFIGTFFNAAFVFCTLQAFAGREPSLEQGLSAAAGRLNQILMWTLVASTVGLLLHALKDMLEKRFGFLGSLLGWVGTAAWSAATYFVVPVLVVDGVGPAEAIRRSMALLREKWGEAVTGEGGLAIASLLLMVPAGLLMAVFAALGVPVLILPVVILYVLAVMLLIMALGTIFRTGVYIYATTGQAPASFSEELIKGTFREKKQGVR